jgi:hypothetical protein
MAARPPTYSLARSGGSKGYARYAVAYPRMSGFVAHCTHAADRKQVSLTSFQPFHAPMHATYIRGHVRLGHACIDYLPRQVYVSHRHFG